MGANRSPDRIPAGAEEEGGGAAGTELTTSSPAGEEDVKMGLVLGLLWLFTGFLQGVRGQGVYGEYVTNINLTLCGIWPPAKCAWPKGTAGRLLQVNTLL